MGIHGMINNIYGIELPGSFHFVAAAESKAVIEIQELLKNDHRLERNEWKAYSYWKYGQSEETSSGERKTIRNSISGNP